MFVIIGILVVFGAICSGYLMEHGHMAVLMQPAELVIIGGAAIGTVLVANPLHVLKKIGSNLLGILKSSTFDKASYAESLVMLYELLSKARKEGLVGIENDIENPKDSPIFSKYPRFLSHHHALDFVSDTFKVIVAGGIEPFDLDQMLELDMEVQHREESQPVTALATMADSLPGLGIVAAVLGVVITMSALGGPPEEIGQKVAAALVGTFLGILLCYGLVGPLSSNLAKKIDEDHGYLYVLRVVMISSVKGISPIMAVEMGRRAIPVRLRPTFQEVETACRSVGKSLAAAAPEGDAA